MKFPWLILCAVLTSFQTGWGQSGLSDAEQQRLADGLYSRGLYDLALVEYQKLIDRDPPPETLDVLLYRAGESAGRANQPDAARRCFQRAVDVGGHGLPAQRSRYRLADMAFQAGDIPGAEALLKEIMANEPDASIEAPVRYMLAQVLEMQRKFSESLRAYKAFIQSFPDDALASYANLRVAALESSDAVSRRTAYEQALRNPPSQELEVEALWGLASLEVAEKNHREAAERYWQLWQKHPDSARVRGSMIYLAWAQLQAGEYRKALTLADHTSAERMRADADTWGYLIAVSHQRLGEMDEAVKAFETLLKQHPESRFRATAGYELASIFASRGEHGKVLELTDEIRKVSGKEGDGLWMLAESSRASGKDTEAVRYYTQLSEQIPDHARVADALYYRAWLLNRSGDENSVAAWLRFVRRFPREERAARALRVAGEQLVKSGKSGEGLDLWLRVIREYPESEDIPALLYKSALLEIRLEREKDAQAHLRTYLDQVPEDAENRQDAWYWLGVLLDRGGQPSDAQAALEKALAGGETAEWAFSARMRLGQSYQNTEQPGKALAVWMPLIEGERRGELSDSLLLWMLGVAEDEEQPVDRLRIAVAMTGENRRAVTRELGFYARAGVLNEQGKVEQAVAAWEAGLKFDSKSEEAAGNGLALGNAYVQLGKAEEALARFSESARLASTLELGEIQALCMNGMGRAELLREEWGKAARHFMGVAVLFDDPALSPENLILARDAFLKSGEAEKARAAEQELQTRYPAYTPLTP
ncbi:MAG: tetratricopeptide repeat protein [Kiritimatiellia bacterium]